MLDSGCSFHITPHRHVLFDFKEVKGGKVLMANNTQCNVEGIGKIRITNTYGKEVIFTDVRYMPKMSRNLISYDMLRKLGETIKERVLRFISSKTAKRCSREIMKMVCIIYKEQSLELKLML